MTRIKAPLFLSRLYYGAPVLLYAGLISYLSSLPGLPESFSTFFGFDKLVHFAEYYPLGWLLYRWFSSQNRVRGGRELLLTLAFGIGFAVVDEWHQSFVPGRDASLYDVMADAAGIAAAALTYPVVQARIFGKRAVSPGEAIP